MKTIFSLLFCLVLQPVWISAQGYTYRPRDIALAPGVNPEQVKDVGADAVESLVAAFVSERWGGNLKQFALLPMQEDIDGGYLSGRLQSSFAGAGREAGYELYTRENKAIAAVLEEIKWGQQFGDTMSPETVQKFGRVQGVQGVLIPRVTLTTIDGVTTVRAILKGYEVETFRELPGGERKAQIVPPPPPAPAPPWWKAWLPAMAIAGALLLVFLVFGMVRKAMRPR